MNSYFDVINQLVKQTQCSWAGGTWRVYASMQWFLLDCCSVINFLTSTQRGTFSAAGRTSRNWQEPGKIQNYSRKRWLPSQRWTNSGSWPSGQTFENNYRPGRVDPIRSPTWQAVGGFRMSTVYPTSRHTLARFETESLN